MTSLVFFLWLAACGKQPVGECVDRGDCGSLEICEDATCKAVECIADADCGDGRYCSASECLPGCGTNEDCLAGEICDAAHECTTYECRTTALDCELGEKCDAADGLCKEVLGCNSCTTDADCGGGVCSDWDPGPGVERYCLVPCTDPGDPEQCGRGLQCRDLSGVGDMFCYADCPAYQVELQDR